MGSTEAVIKRRVICLAPSPFRSLCLGGGLLIVPPLLPLKLLNGCLSEMCYLNTETSQISTNGGNHVGVFRFTANV